MTPALQFLYGEKPSLCVRFVVISLSGFRPKLWLRVGRAELAGPSTGWAGFGQRRELAEGHAPAEFVVLLRHAWREVLVQATEVGAAVVGGGEREGDRHLALQRRVRGLELEHLDDLRIGNEPDEPAVVGVGLRAGLPGTCRRVVGQRDPELAALAGLERMDVAGHRVGDHPL